MLQKPCQAEPSGSLTLDQKTSRMHLRSEALKGPIMSSVQSLPYDAKSGLQIAACRAYSPDAVKSANTHLPTSYNIPVSTGHTFHNWPSHPYYIPSPQRRMARLPFMIGFSLVSYTLPAKGE